MIGFLQIHIPNTEKKKVYLKEADRDVFMAERNERRADRRWLWSGRDELRERAAAKRRVSPDKS